MTALVTPQTVCDRITFALSEHLTWHRDLMRIQQLPTPQIDCPTCMALWAAVQEAARALTQAEAVPPPGPHGTTCTEGDAMTIDEVRAAKAALEQEGLTPSYNAVLARLGHGSKRDVQRFMQQLGGVETVPRAAVWEAEATAAVAVEELPPAVPPPPEPPTTPLARARAHRDQTAQAEHALGEAEQRLKRQRQALDDKRKTLDIGTPGQPTDAADLERRRQVREVLTQLEEIEQARRAVHLKRREAAAVMVEAKDAYEAVLGQAGRWLRRLRQAHREAQASPSASQRGDAREELAQALTQLAALVGQAEAEALAADPALQPAWLRG